ncbi:hypothetical protein LXA43DRAFT_1064991 [Ganoderma leucocontextum]|nr:hypothetical protein LXA43DRAFT_1064991 [Ganoderma leucocontextum]
MANPAEGFLGALLVMSFIACMYVVWVFILETSHTVFAIVIVYHFLVANFGNVAVWGPHWLLPYSKYVLIATTVEAKADLVWFVASSALICSRESLITGFTNSQQELKVSHERLTVGLVGASSVYATSPSNYPAGTYQDPRQPCLQLVEHLQDTRLAFEVPSQPIVTLSLSLGAFTDISIVIIFSFYMLRGRSQYARVSKTLMNLLMLYAINTGAATAATSLSVVIVVCRMCLPELVRIILTILAVAKYASVHITLASTGLAEIGAKRTHLPDYKNCHVRNSGVLIWPTAVYANSFIGSGFGPSVSDVEFATFPSEVHVPLPEDPRSPTAVPRPSVVHVEYSSSTAYESVGTLGQDSAPDEGRSCFSGASCSSLCGWSFCALGGGMMYDELGKPDGIK